MSFPEPTKIQYSAESPLIIVARKKLHLGMLMGQINYGGGEVALNDSYGIRFIRDGSQFVEVELIQYGLSNKPTYQGWVKPVAAKAKKNPKPKKEEIKEEKLDKHITVKTAGDLF